MLYQKPYNINTIKKYLIKSLTEAFFTEIGI